ncbi:hypothetical protein POL68_02040 [Stigmatella sp. ncwal1]|uniref:Uncharacterized protein n=1 Tax=Stigmatella ashevillensis TaxID=2995309 RepID=A0ABT5D2B6_9BACT|nr:hypothetical protein [Stigmatella ashevillena]MDC0707240.1 hypothetical protein [Stigmatella ashevillena]
MSDETKDRVRYGRAQKFQLSPTGSEAVAAYELMLAEARAGSGRAQFDAARASWGAPRGLTAEDGLFLVEFGAGERTIAEAMRNLESCGTTSKELKAAVERLLGCGMLMPVAAPPAPPPTPHRYW